MKKVKLTKKLQLNKENIANLNSIVGGQVHSYTTNCASYCPILCVETQDDVTICQSDARCCYVTYNC